MKNNEGLKVKLYKISADSDNLNAAAEAKAAEAKAAAEELDKLITEIVEGAASDKYGPKE
jgi:hypothetical protein